MVLRVEVSSMVANVADTMSFFLRGYLKLFAKTVHEFTHFNRLIFFALILIRKMLGLTIIFDFHITIPYCKIK